MSEPPACSSAAGIIQATKLVTSGLFLEQTGNLTRAGTVLRQTA